MLNYTLLSPTPWRGIFFDGAPPLVMALVVVALPPERLVSGSWVEGYQSYPKGIEGGLGRRDIYVILPVFLFHTSPSSRARIGLPCIALAGSIARLASLRLVGIGRPPVAPFLR